MGASATQSYGPQAIPVPMRVQPTTGVSNAKLDNVSVHVNVTAASVTDYSGANHVGMNYNVASGLTTAAIYRVLFAGTGYVELLADY